MVDKIKNEYLLAIIGGGAGGLACAVDCARLFGGENIVILEKSDRVGKKLAATGNGRGNIGNTDMSLVHYHGSKQTAKSALTAFTSDKFNEFFFDLGIITAVEEGKIYPLSFQANSLVDMFLAKLKTLNVQTRLNFNAEKIQKKGGLFYIYSAEKEVVKAKYVVLAVGGSSGGHFGTDGGGYALAKSFGHTVTPLYPSLVQLKCDISGMKNLIGIKVRAAAKAYINGSLASETIGDVLFTNYGISGNAIFYLSSVLRGEKVEVRLDFLPDKSAEEIVGFLKAKQKNYPQMNLELLLDGVVHKQLGMVAAKRGGSIEKAVSILKNTVLIITGNSGFANSQVTSGGINAKEINENTFESNLAEGLYLIGEILDVDGDCGGYNLYFAFASAYVAANAIYKKIR